MTDEFYCRLLDYIGSKEKQSLIQILQKKRIRIDGFRMNKDIPSKLLATHIAKNERFFFKILQESFSPTYTDKDAAVNDFSPDTALLGITFFVNSQNVDEDMLTALMKTKPIVSKEKSFDTLSQKAQKKSDEFRQKYLADHKELLTVKQELESTRQYVSKLQKALEVKNEELCVVQDRIKCIQSEYANTCNTLNIRINELEEAIHSQEQLADSVENKILVLLREEAESCSGATTLPYSQITELSKIVNDYVEILFVANDIPFSAKRQIIKIEGIPNKLHSFATMAELIGYIEKRRHK